VSNLDFYVTAKVYYMLKTMLQTFL